ncbi:calcium-binding and coiled-coil domain-containing protein 2 [Cricetulus griseus]|nr:calcium-binding and coiled-coil domain-containing protein 2 [Cricetulus griseus]
MAPRYKCCYSQVEVRVYLIGVGYLPGYGLQGLNSGLVASTSIRLTSPDREALRITNGLDSTMEKTIDEPPISADLLEHCSFSQVVFNSVEKFYIPGGDVMCYYTFTQQFVPRRKDWIGIFKVGWKTTREYYTFMWVALPSDLNKESTKQQEVQFKGLQSEPANLPLVPYYLPKDDEHYQFCYVDQGGVVRGASIPFQFRPETEEDIVVVTTKGKVEEIEQHNKELLRENQELKDSCASLQKQNSDLQAELQRKQEALEALQKTHNKLEQQVEEQKGCWETEVLQLKEYNQKITSENEKMGIRVEQLQAQLSTQEKEMEKLVLRDQDQTGQLQRLKNENSQLLLRLTEQTQKSPFLFLPFEEVKQDQKSQQEPVGMGSKKPDISAVIGAQAVYLVEPGRKSSQHRPNCLRPHGDENFALSRMLSDNKVLYELKKEKKALEIENELLKEENNRLHKMDFYGAYLPDRMKSSDKGAGRQNPGLVYGNPYSGIQESSPPSLLAAIVADKVREQISNKHQMQISVLNCPVCGKVFSPTEEQIFKDHVFCHTL